MDILQFTGTLRQKLLDQGIDENTADNYIDEFKQCFTDKSPEEVSKELEKFGNIDRLAKRIKIITDRSSSESEKIQNNEPKQNGNVRPSPENQKAPFEADEDDLWIGTDNRDAGSDAMNAEPVKDTDFTDGTAADKRQIASDAANDIEIDELDALYRDNVETERKKAEQEGKSFDTYFAAESEEYTKKRKKFYWILAACSPVLAAAAMVIIAVFIALYFGLAVLIIGAVAVLVGIVAAGTILAVFGLIFGIVKFLSVPSIGLYECGLSIMIGSAAMFFGILVYNFAVRLIPYAGHLLWNFAKFLIGQIKRLYIYAKKEFIGI